MFVSVINITPKLEIYIYYIDWDRMSMAVYDRIGTKYAVNYLIHGSQVMPCKATKN